MSHTCSCHLSSNANTNSLSEICQSAITCSKLTTETTEQGVKYVQS